MAQPAAVPPARAVPRQASSPWRRAAAALPRVRGTECTACGYSVPALGQPPDLELAWFERFEGRPCPHCWGLAAGMLAGLALVFASAVADRR